jgi:hypothetical protein
MTVEGAVPSPPSHTCLYTPRRAAPENLPHSFALLSNRGRGRELPPGRPSRMATTALVPKISKTTPCKVAWRSLACAIPPRHLTRRANHLQYYIIAQSVRRKRTSHPRQSSPSGARNQGRQRGCSGEAAPGRPCLERGPWPRTPPRPSAAGTTSLRMAVFGCRPEAPAAKARERPLYKSSRLQARAVRPRCRATVNCCCSLPQGTLPAATAAWGAGRTRALIPAARQVTSDLPLLASRLA